MTVEISPALAAAQLVATQALLQTGPDGPRLLFYPAGDPGAVTPLAILLLNNPIGTVADSALTLDTAELPEGQVTETGAIAWCEFVDGHGAPHIRAPVGAPGSGAPVEVDELNVYAGGFVRLASGVLT